MSGPSGASGAAPGKGPWGGPVGAPGQTPPPGRGPGAPGSGGDVPSDLDLSVGAGAAGYRPSPLPGDVGSGLDLSVGVGATGTGGDAVARELRPGAVLASRYEVQALLGVGGMGAVYRVRDRVRGKDVALKVMLPSLLAREKAAERFQHEAEVALELAHENIVRVFDVGLDPATGLRFFTMELLEGETLREWLEEKKKLREAVEPEEALEIARQLLEALRAAHEKTIHRDLKPENVFVLAGDKLKVKVLDFGIAKLQSASQFTSTSMALGTAYYMAPEQQLDAAKVDARADLYSVCVILYEMLTGELPVGAFRKASEERKGLPPAVDEVILHGLQRKPEGRPASADALLEEVRAIRALLARRPARAGGRRLAFAAAAVLLLAGAAALAYAWRAGLIGREKSVRPERGPAEPARVEGHSAQGGDSLPLALLDLEPTSPAVLPGHAITVRGRLSDPAAGPVEVGGLRQAVDAAGRFEVTLGLRTGEREVTVRAGSPPREVEARIAFEIDETPPVVTLIRPAEGFVGAGGPVDVEARVTDAHPGTEATLRVEVGGKPTGAPLRLRQEAGRVQGRIDPPASAAQATLVLEASDAVGRTGTARRDVTIDRAPPRVVVEAPSDGDVTNAASVPLKVRVEDDHPGDEAVLSLTDPVGASSERRLLLSNGRHDGRLDLPRQDGSARIEVRSADRAGNTGRTSASLTIDRTPPRLTIDSPAEADASGKAGVTVTANEPLSSLVVAGVEQVGGGRPGSGPFRVTVDVPVGGGAATIVARDVAGNEARSEARIRRAAPAAPPVAAGWWDEPLPKGMRRGREKPVLVYDTGKGLEIEMVYVPPGDFVMGADDGDAYDDEKPRHTHPMPKGYFIGRHETTVAQFRRFVEATGYRTDAEKQGSAYVWTGSEWKDTPGKSWRDPSFAQGDDHPVVCVSWNDAKAFCEWAGLRLPSEAEWEKAARGTDGRKYPWGNEGADKDRLNFSDSGLQKTAAVGSYPRGASPYGAQDMAGNVWEWCEDWYDSGAYARYARGEVTPPGAGSRRVFRGGSWGDPAGSAGPRSAPGPAPATATTPLASAP